MISISQILHNLFADKQPAIITQVQTTLEPIHEENANQGCEFLDDCLSQDELSDDETAH